MDSADKTPSQNATELLRMFADIQKDLGELSTAMTALHLALDEVLPDFEARYSESSVRPKMSRYKA